MKNIVYIVSNINKSLAFEWIATKLDKRKYNLSFILLNPGLTSLETFLRENKIPVWHVSYAGKKDFFSALFKIYKILKRGNFSIVHTHLFEANILGLLAAKLAGIKNRIHTRHHAMIHHDYFPRAVWYDRLVNYLSTKIVAPSKNVKEILIEKESVNDSKVRVIYHGFDLNLYGNPSPEKIKKLQNKYIAQRKSPVIGVISRYVDWKGIQYIIPAFRELLVDFPDAFLILANANGPYKNDIQSLLQSLPSTSYVEIEFEEDAASLYHLFDIFVHTPIDGRSEAFGQIYIEALAAGIPSIFTLSGIAEEFIEDKKNALVVNHKKSDEITLSIKELIRNQDLRIKIIERAKESVAIKFELSQMINSLEKLYDS